MSYDRLPEIVTDKSRHLVCAEMKNEKIKVKNIPPTFQYGPYISENLLYWDNFKNCIDEMEWTDDERKEFLKSRYDYWLDIGSEMKKGNVRSRECGIGIPNEFE